MCTCSGCRKFPGVVELEDFLVAVDAPLRTEDFRAPEQVAPVLAAQDPLWTADTAQGYGATSWGMYAGELVRRVYGQRAEVALRSHLTGPLDLDVHLVVPRHDHPRVAPLRMPRLRRSVRGLVPAGNTSDIPAEM